MVRKFGRAEAVIAATAPFAREYMKDPDVAGGCFLSRWSPDAQVSIDRLGMKTLSVRAFDYFIRNQTTS